MTRSDGRRRFTGQTGDDSQLSDLRLLIFSFVVKINEPLSAVSELDVVVSGGEDVSQGVQDQRVHLVFDGVFIVVVLHREDAVQRKSRVHTELLHLCDINHKVSHDCSHSTELNVAA